MKQLPRTAKSRALAILIFSLSCAPSAAQDTSLRDQVTIRRTAFGVPHIIADNLKAVAFGLAYAELEDRGEKVILPLISARGERARFEGQEYVESSLYAKLAHDLTIDTYDQLDQDTRDILEGFAEGVNYFLSLHGDKFPDWYARHFSGVDVAAVSNGSGIPSARNARSFLRWLYEMKERRKKNSDVGSNVWAFGPERTKSGNAILMRNPHLSWEAGYYEAHITVPGKVNFYGDFRIAGMFGIICGFNNHLGWSTTNNAPDLEEVYALAVDPQKPDHYVLDGKSIPIQRKMVEIAFKNGDGLGLANREWLYTPFGPIIHREDGFIYVLKRASWQNFRRGMQFTAMLKAKNLHEWKEAMRMRAIDGSNYTYADADGNIFYIWNASTPALRHEFLGDTTAHEVSKASQIWSDFVGFEQLPQLENPTGGYVQNSNDPFYFTNLNNVFSLEGQPGNFPEPRLRLRSQHSLSLIHNNDRYSLEDIVEMKHSMRAPAAERMKDDLIAILRNQSGNPEVKLAADYLEGWDNTYGAESQGSVLFNEWFFIYRNFVGRDSLFKVEWDAANPTTTPYGINRPDSALKAFDSALDATRGKFGTWKLAWGDVHRVRRGDVDVPVGGGSAAVGNFRVLYFNEDEDGKRSVAGGDGWVFAVEFGKEIKAYSVLAYGQSNDPESPHYSDQATMFAEGKLKRVAFSEREIKNELVTSYRPGEE